MTDEQKLAKIIYNKNSTRWSMTKEEKIAFDQLKVIMKMYEVTNDVSIQFVPGRKTPFKIWVPYWNHYMYVDENKLKKHQIIWYFKKINTTHRQLQKIIDQLIKEKESDELR